jgi:hypothetical protein
METMSLKRYELINRVYAKGQSVIGIVLRIVVSIIACIVLLFVFIGVLITGEIKGLLYSGVCIIGVCIILAKNIMNLRVKKARYIQIRTIIDFYSDKLVMHYDYIDREDGMGPRSEEYTFNYRDIIDLEFSVPLQCLNIKCGPLLKVHFHIDSKVIERDYRTNKRYYRNLIYLPQDQIDEFLKDIQQYSGISVRELN